jgi:hypothetical protein
VELLNERASGATLPPVRSWWVTVPRASVTVSIPWVKSRRRSCGVKVPHQHHRVVGANGAVQKKGRLLAGEGNPRAGRIGKHDRFQARKSLGAEIEGSAVREAQRIRAAAPVDGIQCCETGRIRRDDVVPLRSARNLEAHERLRQRQVEDAGCTGFERVSSTASIENVARIEAADFHDEGLVGRRPGRGLDRIRQGVADGEQALMNLVIAVDPRRPGDDPATVSHRLYARGGLVPRRDAVYQHFRTGGRAVGPIGLLVNAEPGTVLVVRRPGHNPTAVGQRRDADVALAIRRRRVDPRLGSSRGAVGVVTLLIDAGGRSVLFEGLPHCDPAAVRQGGETGAELAVCRSGVDLGLRPAGGAVGVVPLLITAITRPVLSTGCPAHHPPAIGELRHVSAALVIGRGGVHQGFGASRRAIGVVALQVDVTFRTIAAFRLPAHHPAAIGKRRVARGELVAGHRRVDPGLGSDGKAVGAIPLLVDAAVDLPFALIDIVGGIPGDHPPAIGESCHDGKVLVVVRPGIDLRLAPMGGAVGIVALLINAETGSVLVG